MHDGAERARDGLESRGTHRLTNILQLKEQDSFRKDFIGNLAHELKTAVFNIQGYILTLLEGALEDRTTTENS